MKNRTTAIGLSFIVFLCDLGLDDCDITQPQSNYDIFIYKLYVVLVVLVNQAPNKTKYDLRIF